jgi:hypothetical protein
MISKKTPNIGFAGGPSLFAVRCSKRPIFSNNLVPLVKWENIGFLAHEDDEVSRRSYGKGETRGRVPNFGFSGFWEGRPPCRPTNQMPLN